MTRPLPDGEPERRRTARMEATREARAAGRYRRTALRLLDTLRAAEGLVVPYSVLMLGVLGLHYAAIEDSPANRQLLRVNVSRARRLLAPGERIYTYRDRGYALEEIE